MDGQISIWAKLSPVLLMGLVTIVFGFVFWFRNRGFSQLFVRFGFVQVGVFYIVTQGLYTVHRRLGMIDFESSNDLLLGASWFVWLLPILLSTAIAAKISAASPIVYAKSVYPEYDFEFNRRLVLVIVASAWMVELTTVFMYNFVGGETMLQSVGYLLLFVLYPYSQLGASILLFTLGFLTSQLVITHYVYSIAQDDIRHPRSVSSIIRSAVGKTIHTVSQKLRDEPPLPPLNIGSLPYIGNSPDERPQQFDSLEER